MRPLWNTLATQVAAALLIPLSLLQAAEKQRFESLDPALLDHSTFQQWVAGAESPLPPNPEITNGPLAVVWTKQERPYLWGVKYGVGRDAGRRHLRVGFVQEIPVGSVLVGGGGTLSVLKSGAAYPGNLNDDSQWIAAERLVDGKKSHAEVAEGDYGMWVLPPGTRTRAFRFSHVPAAGDRELAGTLSAAWVLSQRWGNVAPQASVQTRARDDASAKIVDESNNRTWQTWENAETGAVAPISSEHPEIMTLTWTKPVTLGGVCFLWTGFGACEIDAFVGADDANVNEAQAASWKQVAAGGGFEPWYPLQLGPNWVPFAEDVSTRALRVRITAPAKPGHPHYDEKIKDGRRVWLAELVALAPLRDAALSSLVLPRTVQEPPPIPVRFNLPEAGLVTLVIEDRQGRRVRNLVSETPFPAGENVAWWDGSDDLLRDPEAARHGVYSVPSRPVSPGDYVVRGLWRKPLELRYEFSIYSAGKPAWTTADNTGCWLTTHTPPTSIAAVPGSRTADGQPLVFMGCYVAEGGHGLQWLHEDGTKVGGQHWVGGTWTGAPTLAVDLGKDAVPDHLCYVGSVWEGELRLTAKTRALGDKEIFKAKLGDDPRPEKPTDPRPPLLKDFEGGDRVFVLSAIAACNGTIVCSLLRQNELVMVDVKSGAITGRRSMASPRGIAFDDKGRLFTLSEKKLIRFDSLADEKGQVLIDGELEDPRHLARDARGNWLVSDRGASHQIKVFDSNGRLLRRIGRAGAPATGVYDPLRMNQPNGLGVDSQGRVWVAENDNYPRRVSVWSSAGRLERAFYGPTEYGGGGVLDPLNPSVFFYKGMEFSLDWRAGTDSLKRVFARPNPILEGHYGPYSPDTPLYPGGNAKRRYFTSCFTHNPTNGDNVAFIWLDAPKEAKLVAACGDAHSWWHLRDETLRAAWPEETKPEEENPQPDKHALFVWVDSDGDSRPQVSELRMVKGNPRGVTVTRDLSFLVTQLDDAAVIVRAKTTDARGLPRYELEPERLGPAGGQPPSSGGSQSLLGGDWVISTNAPAPFSPFGLGGSLRGESRWSYPSAWPGLHASHEAAVPDQPGMIVGHTRLLGDCVQGRLGPMFCINGNMGNMYLMTADGLFVATLFHDIRLKPNWSAPVATRNMDVTDVSLHDENFWPSISQTSDGRVFLIDGARTSLVRIDGLDSLTRLSDQPLTITTSDLENARNWFARVETARQRARGGGTLKVAMREQAPAVDGEIGDWPQTTDWAVIDRRGTAANFNSDSRPYEVSAAVCVNADRLFAAWRTTEKDLLNNSGETPNALFKTGGCLDLMLQTDTEQRLLVTMVKDQPRAVLYRTKVSGTKEPVAFSSPWRTIHIDSVEDVTSQVTFATNKAGLYEISVSLSLLHWDVKAQPAVRADIGVLRGSNGQTTQRVYWSNKATAITADVPSEAELTPLLWGQWKVE